jgi:hypothetical protein
MQCGGREYRAVRTAPTDNYIGTLIQQVHEGMRASHGDNAVGCI